MQTTVSATAAGWPLLGSRREPVFARALRPSLRGRLSLPGALPPQPRASARVQHTWRTGTHRTSRRKHGKVDESDGGKDDSSSHDAVTVQCIRNGSRHNKL